MRVLFTGSREWDDWDAIRAELRQLPGDATIIHGDGRGLDKMADWLARNEFGLPVLRFPADWEKHGKSAGHIRNKQMRDAGRPTHGIAFLIPRLECRGTRGMVALLREQGIPVRIVGDWEESSDW